MTRRLLAAALLVAALLVAAVALAQPAAAHDEWSADTGWDPSLTGGMRFTEPPVLPFVFAHEGTGQPGIEKVTFSLSRPDGQPETVAACQPPAPSDLTVGTPQSRPNRLESALPITLPCNGRYTVTATAFTQDATPLHPTVSRAITLTFDTAIPPPPPTDLAVEVADLDGDRAAAVTWVPPEAAPPDLVGYVVERSRSANSGFEIVGESVEPEFVDGEAAVGGVFHYRVRAMRLGPDTELVGSEATASASVDVPRPATTTTTTPGQTTRPNGDLSGFGQLQQQADRIRPGIALVTPGPVTTIDGGFQPTLPFDPADPDALATTQPPAPPGGLASASVQTFEDADSSDRKAVLAPVAGALALLMVFLQLRWLLRQASTA